MNVTATLFGQLIILKAQLKASLNTTQEMM